MPDDNGLVLAKINKKIKWEEKVGIDVWFCCSKVNHVHLRITGPERGTDGSNQVLKCADLFVLMTSMEI